MALTPSAEKSLALLTAAGVPAFRHPESCAEAMAICLLRPAPQPVPTLAEPTRQALDALEAGRVNGFDERRAADFFGALGVPLAKALAIPDAKRVAAAVTEIGAPVVLKILSRDIAHKTEAGGVALGLPDGQTAALAAREMEKRVKAHSPHAKLDGFLIQKMERGLAEVILGFRRDPLVGPTVTVGLGGVLAEIYKDAATRLAPVDEAEARQMIDEVKGLATIRGYRNLPCGDIAELAKAIAAFSTLAHQAFADVSEAEDQSAAGQARRRGRGGGGWPCRAPASSSLVARIRRRSQAWAGSLSLRRCQSIVSWKDGNSIGTGNMRTPGHSRRRMTRSDKVAIMSVLAMIAGAARW